MQLKRLDIANMFRRVDEFVFSTTAVDFLY